MLEHNDLQFNNKNRNNQGGKSFQDAEEKIMKYATRDIPASNDFKHRLKQEILEKRAEERAREQRFVLFPAWVPAFTMVVIFVLAVGFVYLNYGNDIKVAFQGRDKIDRVNQVATGDDSNGKAVKLFDFKMVKPVFAKVEQIGDDIVPAVPIMRVDKSELEDVSNGSFSEGQIKSLEEDGFFLTENNIVLNDIDETKLESMDDFYVTYRKKLEDDDALFVSSDYVLHTYDKLINDSFRAIEEEKFQSMLQATTRALFADSISKYNKATDEKIKESYKRLSVFYLVPLVILDGNYNMETYFSSNCDQRLVFKLEGKEYNGLELSDEIYKLAVKEIDLINQSKGLDASPLFTPYRSGYLHDYSMYNIKSECNEKLTGYYLAMNWYGGMGFSLDSEELTRDAIIITGQINNVKTDQGSVSEIWSELSSAIEFFIGEPDSLTPFDYTGTIQKVYGNDITIGELVDDSLLSSFIDIAKDELPDPRIISEAVDAYDDLDRRQELLKSIKQFRFMGKRFTLDAYIHNNLSQGENGVDKRVGEKLPSTPTALMTASLLSEDCDATTAYLNSWIDKKASGSSAIINKHYNLLEAELDRYDQDIWQSNIYWGRLDIFRTILRSYGEGYPIFMQSKDWQSKNLETVMGSYAELKHVKSKYPGGLEEPFIVDSEKNIAKSYVEPDLEFWNKIIALTKAAEEGLLQKDLMPEEYEKAYSDFIEACEYFKYISRKELVNEEINNEEFEKLNRFIKEKFANIYQARDYSGGELSRTAIVSRIHTDLVENKSLYEATGKPYLINIAIKDINGVRVVRGAVYNHYEFTYSLDTQVTDSNWQEKVYSDDYLPAKDFRSKDLIVY